jgi:hypothetical protein
MDLKINDANLNPFELKINMVAEFNYGPEDKKPDIHTSSFDQLFPFVRQIISTTTSFTGMPALMIPIIKLNKSTVVINEPTESSPLN